MRSIMGPAGAGLHDYWISEGQVIENYSWFNGLLAVECVNVQNYKFVMKFVITTLELGFLFFTGEDCDLCNFFTHFSICKQT